MNKLLKRYVSEVTKDVLDKALDKSHKRREEFRKQWQQDNPPRVGKTPDSVAMREARIKKVYRSVLLEADPTTPDPNAGTAQPPAPATGTDPTALAPDATTDPTAAGAPGGDVAPLPTTMGGTPDPNAPPADATTGTDATGGLDLGGGGGFGGGGGGGAGAGPTDDTGAPAAGGEDADTSGAGGEGEEESGDPITNAVDSAKDLLDQTRDIPTILKSMKQVVQDKFEKPDHALGLVKALYDTDDSTLRSVALRLYQFIKAE